KSVFGDLILNKQGEVFVSDGVSNTILKVNETTGQLDSFFKSEEFWNIQGITFSDDEKYLFISDYIKGPFRLEIATKKLIMLELETPQSLKGVDGMLFYKNSLIAIQNGVSPLRVSRYYLNQEQNKIIDCKIIDRAHPAFGEPTIGSLNGSTFYFVANSLWGAYDKEFNLKTDLIRDVVILKASLSK
ncbi:MAG: hypothetical protein RIA63_10355, partial [Cyclobacteriaceae bacterium]